MECQGAVTYVSACDLGNPVRDSAGGRFQRIIGEMDIAGGRVHVVVARQLSDHRKTLADQQTAAGVAVTQVMNPHPIEQSHLRMCFQ